MLVPCCLQADSVLSAIHSLSHLRLAIPTLAPDRDAIVNSTWHTEVTNKYWWNESSALFQS